MTISYATRRDASGNRYLLIIDHDNKQYSRESFHWFCKEDFVEISKSDRRKLLEVCENSGYQEVERLQAGIF